jgi:metallo-beta-lactamase family protein
MILGYNESMKLTFCGGVGEVTGSNYLLETENTKILIDCGLHQGTAFCEDHNFVPFVYKPEGIEAVLVTHAHVDHIGRLPQLYKAGFRKNIYSTPPTMDFAEFLLLDSEHVLKDEAQKAGKPPLYGNRDVLEVMKLWRKVPYYQSFRVGDFEVEFLNAGHILGSSFISVSAEGKRVIFSGDLGNTPAPFIKGIDYIDRADYVLVESTYGNRIHEQLDKRKDLLEDFIEDTVKANGVLMIPAFALERTQELLFELNELVENKRIPKVPVFVDSPLAIKLTTVFQKYSKEEKYFNDEALRLLRGGDTIFSFPGLRLTLTSAQSKEINDVPQPKVIVAGSGMSNAGRIIFHEKRYLSDPKNTLLFVGYQAAGSMGRQIQDGASKVRIMGEEIHVACRRVSIGGYSAHADQPQLIKWVEPMRTTVKKVFVVQGEAEAADTLAQKLRDELAVEAEVPKAGESVIL